MDCFVSQLRLSYAEITSKAQIPVALKEVGQFACVLALHSDTEPQV